MRELLGLVGLAPGVASLKPRSLAAGAQQRVSIARAIAAEPDLIVLDEPTSALTPLARVGIVRLLRDLQARLGTSYLFISHDLSTVEHLSHSVAVMYLGQVVEVGTREQIFAEPRHPYSRALLAAHLVPDPAHRRVDAAPEVALAGEIPSPVDCRRAATSPAAARWPRRPAGQPCSRSGGSPTVASSAARPSPHAMARRRWRPEGAAMRERHASNSRHVPPAAAVTVRPSARDD